MKRKTNGSTTFTFSQVVKLLGLSVGRNRFMKYLRENGYLMRNNEPYQSHVDAGYFKYQNEEITLADGKKLRFPTSVVTIKGLYWLEKIVERASNQEGLSEEN